MCDAIVSVQAVAATAAVWAITSTMWAVKAAVQAIVQRPRHRRSVAGKNEKCAVCVCCPKQSGKLF